MAGLVPAIHACPTRVPLGIGQRVRGLARGGGGAWMAGTSPAMTTELSAQL
jgi:hypothetical protein